jgi:ribosomal protein L37AE/L43A
VRCPKDGGVIAERRGRFRPFYGCVNYPNCDFTLSARPVPEACPQCANPYLLVRERKSGNVFACDKPGCGFEKPAGTVPELIDVFLPSVPSGTAAGKKTASGGTKKRAASASRKKGEAVEPSGAGEPDAPPAAALAKRRPARAAKKPARRRAS